ncbi:hypothetical protein DWY69_21590 [Eisenbergiella massiliensis]|uniref:Uncharacterized protein n=1 Tax=Eisenbergiella massiliensis TaxID=1720294 RepID=A0A3E3IKB9_9FIRM|nr:hypothetical protein DWY69_21590 [Eisenbergiella massiliensis]
MGGTAEIISSLDFCRGFFCVQIFPEAVRHSEPRRLQDGRRPDRRLKRAEKLSTFFTWKKICRCQDLRAGSRRFL